MKWKKPKTIEPGVRVREVEDRLFRGKPDRYFTLRFRVNGGQHEEKLGWASEGWNLAKARAELARLKAAAATGEGAVTLRERRETAQREREAAANAPTLQRVWEAYRETVKGRVLGNYIGYVQNHLQAFMPMRIETLRTHHIESLQKELEQKALAPATVRHVLSLIRQIVFWGAKHGFNEQPPIHELYFSLPRLDNQVTENLTDEELGNLFNALDRYPNQRLASSMKFAFLTGIRRYAIFHLEWRDIDFVRKQICLKGEHAKSGKTEYIPLSQAVEDVLRGIDTGEQGLVFGQVDFQSRAVKRLIEYVRPFLPAGFRPYHGLRHSFASRLAAGGASLFEIQKLLTHGDASMTQRYAHLLNSQLRQTADIVSEALKRALSTGQDDEAKQR